MVGWLETGTLLRIASDASELPSRRAAAAIALSSSASTEERERLAEASRAIAHPQLRVAVQAAVADESTEALAAALEALAEEEAVRAKT